MSYEIVLAKFHEYFVKSENLMLYSRWLNLQQQEGESVDDFITVSHYPVLQLWKIIYKRENGLGSAHCWSPLYFSLRETPATRVTTHPRENYCFSL